MSYDDTSAARWSMGVFLQLHLLQHMSIMSSHFNLFRP